MNHIMHQLNVKPFLLFFFLSPKSWLMLTQWNNLEISSFIYLTRNAFCVNCDCTMAQHIPHEQTKTLICLQFFEQLFELSFLCHIKWKLYILKCHFKNNYDSNLIMLEVSLHWVVLITTSLWKCLGATQDYQKSIMPWGDTCSCHKMKDVECGKPYDCK